EGAWRTPLGDVRVDDRLAGEILSRGAADNLVQANVAAHESEHSIEVQLPLIQHLFPEARIVPILVPGDGRAVALGRLVGEVIRDRRADAVCLGSSDLTHYGPMYGFTPKGMGEAALRWVRDENDRRMLDLIAGLKAEEVVPEAKDHLNACGSGAIAAALAAGRVLGATKGVIVRYTTSFDVMQERMGRADYDAAVGYPGAVF
ncbi:MAG: AmmeMemoRadiSam system protein B, partial [Planctomycetes bacterium]|nr:AmmeMemoRadiSam system protein B [Planctomycetota bacterium]